MINHPAGELATGVGVSFYCLNEINSVTNFNPSLMKQLKLITVLALLFVTRIAAIAQPAGTGSFEDPYRITSAMDLIWISNNPSIWGQGKYLVQMNDIDFTGVSNFTPIGNATNPAILYYNGQNFTIDSLNINKDHPYVGIFGYLEEGSSLRNMNISRAKVNCSSAADETYVGVLVGLNKGSIFNCHIRNSAVTSPGDYVGGMAGKSYGKIEQCYVWTHSTGRNYVGGIVGALDGGLILVSYPAGEFRAVGIGAGGIAGMLENGGRVSNCYSDDDVVAADNYAGGIAGRKGNGAGIIEYCYTSGTDVSVSTSSTVKYVGDISGDANITQIANFYERLTLTPRNMGVGSTVKLAGFFVLPGYFIEAGWDLLCEGANGNKDYWKVHPTENLSKIKFTWDGEVYSSNCRVWNGDALFNDNWTNSANWLGAMPGKGDGVYIRGNAPRNPTLNQDVELSTIIFGLEGSRDKKIILGGYNLTATRIYNADDTRFIRTDGSGRLKTTIEEGETFTFPIGQSGYSPVTVTNNTGAADVFSARTKAEVLVNGESGSPLSPVHGIDRIWFIGNNNGNIGAGVNMTFQWNTNDIESPADTLVLLHYNPAGIQPSGWDKYTNVSVIDNSLTINGYKDGLSAFAILTDWMTPLPVTWGSFTASKQQDHALLKWTTLGEYNSKNYFVQHSVDGRSWRTIGSVASAGNTSLTSNYQFVHENPVIGKNYYYLLQKDIDGRQSISKTVVLQWTSATVFQVYPNPAANGSVQVNTGKAGILQFFNASGALVKQVQVSAGNNTIDISSLTKGYYILVSGEEKASLIIK